MYKYRLIFKQKSYNLFINKLFYFSGRHYYWNTKTDEVSWLSPKHPRSKISLPAEKLRGIFMIYKISVAKEAV